MAKTAKKRPPKLVLLDGVAIALIALVLTHLVNVLVGLVARPDNETVWEVVRGVNIAIVIVVLYSYPTLKAASRSRRKK